MVSLTAAAPSLHSSHCRGRKLVIERVRNPPLFQHLNIAKNSLTALRSRGLSPADVSLVWCHHRTVDLWRPGCCTHLVVATLGSLQHCSTAGHCVVTVLTEHWLHCSAVSLSAARLHAATSTALAPLNTNTRIHTGVYPLYCTHPVHTNTLYTETGHMLRCLDLGSQVQPIKVFFICNTSTTLTLPLCTCTMQIVDIFHIALP